MCGGKIYNQRSQFFHSLVRALVQLLLGLGMDIGYPAFAGDPDPSGSVNLLSGSDPGQILE